MIDLPGLRRAGGNQDTQGLRGTAEPEQSPENCQSVTRNCREVGRRQTRTRWAQYKTPRIGYLTYESEAQGLQDMHLGTCTCIHSEDIAETHSLVKRRRRPPNVRAESRKAEDQVSKKAKKRVFTRVENVFLSFDNNNHITAQSNHAQNNPQLSPLLNQNSALGLGSTKAQARRNKGKTDTDRPGNVAKQAHGCAECSYECRTRFSSNGRRRCIVWHAATGDL